MTKTPSPLQITTLPNGLRVVTYKIDRQATAMSFRFAVGKRYESAEEVGISHFLEHILINGSKKYPSNHLVKDSVERFGGHMGGSTGDETTQYWSNILIDKIDQSLDTLADITQHPLLNPVDIEKQKSIILEEINRRKDDPKAYIHYLMDELLWPDQPMGRSLEVEEKAILKIDHRKLRSYLEKYYTNKNTVVTIVGNIEHDTWVKKIAEEVKNLSEGSPSKFTPAKEQPGIKIKTSTKATSTQTNLKMSLYGPSSHDQERLPIALTLSILDKRLREELRYKRALTYSIGAGGHGFSDIGTISLAGGFKQGHVKEAIEVFLEQLKILKTTFVSDAELSGAKARVKSGTVFENESAFALRDTYSFRVIAGIEPLLLEESLELFDQVSPEDITRVCHKYFNETYKIAAIGPAEDIKVLESLYGKSTQKA